jgi:hypothetical protein
LSPDGNTALVGAPGYGAGTRSGAYIFARNGGRWGSPQKVTPVALTPGDWFGKSVAVAGTVAMIGAPLRSSTRGALYVYGLVDGQWIQQQQIDGSPGDKFGMSVAFDGVYTLVGAAGGGRASFLSSGANGWSIDGSALSHPLPGFGQSVAFTGPPGALTAIVGATRDGNTMDDGEAVMYGPPESALLRARTQSQ